MSANSENRRIPIVAAEARRDWPTSLPVDLDGWAANAARLMAQPASAKEETAKAATRYTVTGAE